MSIAELISDHQTALTTEKRSVQRHRVLKAGTIVFGGSGIPGMVRDISDSGAALIVNNDTDVPKEFLLAIVSCSLISKCRMVAPRSPPGRCISGRLVFETSSEYEPKEESDSGASKQQAF